LSVKFRDSTLPLAVRLHDLMSQLGFEEKLGLLHQYQAPVERLGLDSFCTGTEALHGLTWQGESTVFPQALGLASSWDRDLLRQVAHATSEEVLAAHSKGSVNEGRHADAPISVGRNIWAPVVNLLRDPRWGRNEEGYSEDPHLTADLACGYCSGLRGTDPHVLKTAPTLKHFLGYNNETERRMSSSHLPPRVLHEYELPAYRPALEQGLAVAVMLALNFVNGRPMLVSSLINSELRSWTEDEILVVSDAFAPSNLHGEQQFDKDPVVAYAAALKAGLDSFTQDHGDPKEPLSFLRQGVERGLLSEADIDTAVRRVLTLRFRLGEFDPSTPFDGATEAALDAPAHRELARESARRSFVLLENDGTLPLTGVRRLAVIGQAADKVLLDWYSGTPPYRVSPLDALAGRCEILHSEGVDRIRLRSAQGWVTADPEGGALGVGPHGESFDLFDWGGGIYALRALGSGRYLSLNPKVGVLVNDQPEPYGWKIWETFRLVEQPDGAVVLRHVHTDRPIGLLTDGQRLGLVESDEAALSVRVELVSSGARQAAELAAQADAVVVLVGDHPLINGRESEDRPDLDLPAAQLAVARAAAAANARTVMVVTSGCPLAWPSEPGELPSVLWSAHGGQEHGNALADVLFGDAEPQGRLTQTWYRSAADLPDLFEYDIIAADSTYQYFAGDPQFPFGHGLGYTDFAYRDFGVEAAGGTVTATVTVTNTGGRAGTEVVQLYSRQLESRVKQPLRRLRGFARARLEAGESRTVTITLPSETLSFWDVTRGRFALEDADHEFMVGRSCTDVRARAAVRIAGEVIPPRRGRMRTADFDGYHAVTLLDRGPVHGDTVLSHGADAWLLFHAVDVDGAIGAVLAVSGTAGESVCVRLDDPVDGPVLGTCEVPAEPAGPDAAVGLRFPAVAGVRDVYLVFGGAGVSVSELEFERAGQPTSAGRRHSGGRA
jgi:beta-glucosidase